MSAKRSSFLIGLPVVIAVFAAMLLPALQQTRE